MIIQLITMLIWLVAILLCVALLTLLERKLLASLQRRLGPDTVGYVGILQPIADAVKLVTKQTSSTYNSSQGLFYIAPLWALIVILTAWGLLTKLYINNYYSDLAMLDHGMFTYTWLTLLAVLSLSIYSALLLGWAANSSYSLAGSLRSSASLVSYELILATSGLIPMIVAQDYGLLSLIDHQVASSYVVALLPVFFIYVISVLAETSRVPFDLVEAESELVSGYMTEHASVAFVLLFLTEYASILFFSTLTAIIWWGVDNYIELALYVNVMLTIIILMRAVLPRMRYDQLINVCWLHLLPLVFTLAILAPSLVYVLL